MVSGTCTIAAEIQPLAHEVLSVVVVVDDRDDHVSGLLALGEQRLHGADGQAIATGIHLGDLLGHVLVLAGVVEDDLRPSFSASSTKL